MAFKHEGGVEVSLETVLQHALEDEFHGGKVSVVHFRLALEVDPGERTDGVEAPRVRSEA